MDLPEAAKPPQVITAPTHPHPMPRRITTTDVVQPVLTLVALMPSTGPGRPPIGARIAAALAELGLRPVPATAAPLHRLLQRTGQHDIPTTTVRFMFDQLLATHRQGGWPGVGPCHPPP
jgi:hypothetical protein